MDLLAKQENSYWDYCCLKFNKLEPDEKNNIYMYVLSWFLLFF